MASPDASEKHARFVAEYLVDRNATKAALRAGYSPRTAYSQGCRLLKDAEIRARIDASSVKLAERLRLTTEKIAEHLSNIILADPNELIEYRRECCRHCWGEGFGYQRTPSEMRSLRATYDKKLEAWISKGGDAESFPPFDAEGGVDYNRTQDPNPECPECHGEGEERVYPKDTRALGPEASALYAGLKITKDGLEIKMHSKEKALELYGRHLGMFHDSVRVQVVDHAVDLKAALDRAQKNRETPVDEADGEEP